MNKLIPLIWLAGVVHLAIASANFFLPAKLEYEANLAKVSPVVRQVFWVHSVYIVLVLLGLAGLCLLFAAELAGGSALGRALSGFIAVFWGARVCVQLFYYDAALKRQYRSVHVLFTAAFVYLAVVFGYVAIEGGGA